MFQCSSENKKKSDDHGTIEHGRYWIQSANGNHFSGKMRKSEKSALQKSILMLGISPKKWKKKKLDCQKRKHKSQYNSTISLNNSKYNKDIFIYLTCAWRWWQTNIWEMFTEVVNMCYRQWQAILIDIYCVTRNKKNYVFYWGYEVSCF